MADVEPFIWEGDAIGLKCFECFDFMLEGEFKTIRIFGKEVNISFHLFASACSMFTGLQENFSV